MLTGDDLNRAEVWAPDNYEPLTRLRGLLAASPGETDLSAPETHELLYDLWLIQSRRRSWPDGYAGLDITIGGGPIGDYMPQDGLIVVLPSFNQAYTHASINNVARIPLAATATTAE